MAIDHTFDSGRPFDVITEVARSLLVPLREAPRAAPAEVDLREERRPAAPAAEATAPARRRTLMERIDHWFWMQRQRDLERYLAQAVDLADLEARIKSLNRTHPERFL